MLRSLEPNPALGPRICLEQRPHSSFCLRPTERHVRQEASKIVAPHHHVSQRHSLGNARLLTACAHAVEGDCNALFSFVSRALTRGNSPTRRGVAFMTMLPSRKSWARSGNIPTVVCKIYEVVLCLQSLRDDVFFPFSRKAATRCHATSLHWQRTVHLVHLT